MGKQKRIRVVMFNEGEKPRVVMIKNTLKKKQMVVGGLIDRGYLGHVPPYAGFDIVFNDEFLMTESKVNPYLRRKGIRIKGNAFISKVDERTGEYVSMSVVEANAALSHFLEDSQEKQGA